jgi:protein TonB
MAAALFQYREWIATLSALMVMALLAAAPAPRLAPPKPPEQRLMQVTLEELPDQPTPAPPVSAPQPSPAAAPVTPLKPAPLPKQKQAPAAIAEIGRTVEAAAATAAEPTPAPKAEPVAAPAVAAPIPVPPSPAPSHDSEDRYVAGVRSHLEAIKRYPTSREARLEHPVGMVELWFVLDHAGKLQDVGIEKSSGSPILDQAAMSTVKRGEYTAFPTDAWKGEATHRFTVQLNFTLQQ